MHAATGRFLVENTQQQITEQQYAAPAAASFPATLDINGLSRILLRSPDSIRKAMSRKAHGLLSDSGIPPARRVPGCRNLIWLVDEVMDWLREQPVCDSARIRKRKEEVTETPQQGRRRGRPRKSRPAGQKGGV